MADLISEDIVIRDRPEAPDPQTYRRPRGRAAGAGDPATRASRSSRLEPIDLIGVGDRHVVVVLRMPGRGRGSGVPVEEEIAHLWTVDDGKAVAMQVYSHAQDALRDARSRIGSAHAPHRRLRRHRIHGTPGTAEELIAAGERPVLAGRSAERLASLAAELGGGLETAVADVARPASCGALVERGDVLVATVGPFMRFGRPAVEAAVAAGATYIDSTGEPPFIREVFERYGEAAERADCALMTAMGYDFVPGNLAGALALERAGDAAVRVDTGYFFTGTPRPA